MSQGSKIGITIAVIAVAIVGVWALNRGGDDTVTSNYQPTTSTNPSSDSAIKVTAQSSSDASLNQDMTGVDTQMTGLTTDTANADQGLNDKPIEQAQ